MDSPNGPPRSDGGRGMLAHLGIRCTATPLTPAAPAPCDLHGHQFQNLAQPRHCAVSGHRPVSMSQVRVEAFLSLGVLGGWNLGWGWGRVEHGSCARVWRPASAPRSRQGVQTCTAHGGFGLEWLLSAHRRCGRGSDLLFSVPCASAHKATHDGSGPCAPVRRATLLLSA